MNRATANSCVIIPTYNNAGTVCDVAARAVAQGYPVIVVNDGSTDDTAARLAQSGLPLTVLTHPRNRGKGVALRTAFSHAREQGFRYAITLDADGQHYPEDIPVLVEAIAQHPGALVVGSRNLQAENMPGGNSFANRFSNFWFRVQTARSLPDTQTGYRAYPLDRLPSLRILTSRYEAELALLVFSAWKGIELVPVAIRVCYPEDRVSSFRPFRDFARISFLNTLLCVLALVYGYPRMLIHKLLNHTRH
ncbi:MAG: glycosyltransferase family 2 protein [Bacteroidales bacterium]|nr:glycosyltransferase family 2 protein [Bacteroidales bacterium]